jgi:hypothetical protein
MEDISALVASLNPVPVCASCKRVRNDDHFWEQVETHFQRHFDLDVSYGVCADCKPQLLGSDPIHLTAPGPRRAGPAKAPRMRG